MKNPEVTGVPNEMDKVNTALYVRRLLQHEALTVVDSLVKKGLSAVTSKLRLRQIFRDENSGPYLSRWYLFRSEFFAAYIHRFHTSDWGDELHNHPWSYSMSFVLTGGYVEERKVGDEIVMRIVRPFTWNVIREGDFHRVDLIEKDAWTLFLAGPRVKRWGFWDRHVKQFRDFEAPKEADE